MPDGGCRPVVGLWARSALAAIAILAACGAVVAQSPPAAGSSDLLADTAARPNPGNEPLGTVSGPAAGAPDPKLQPKWKSGVWTESKEKDFVVHVGGVLQYDGVWFTAQKSVTDFPGGTGPFHDGVDPRRLRIRTEGTMYKSTEFFLELEFANGFNPTGQPVALENTFLTPGPTDAWVGLTEVPIVGNVRIGNQKEPFSLERLNSARFLEFMERSYLFDLNPTSSFTNNRSPGILFFRNLADGRVYTGIGFFKATRTVYGYGIGDGEYAVTGRITGLPIWKPDENVYWHVGGAMSHRDPSDNNARIRVRDQLRNGVSPVVPSVADTGPLTSTDLDLFGLETAAVYGPATFQAEYQATLTHGAQQANGIDQGTLLFHGCYAETLFFLTGESRKWRTGPANFDRVIPKRPLHLERHRVTGCGAWELAARYSYLDLNAGKVVGGVLHGVTLGVNWYWTATTKMQVNYDYLYRDKTANPLAKGIVHGLGTRIAYDF